MSQIVRAIEASDTGSRKIINDSFTPLFQDVFSIKSEVRSDLTLVGQVYKVGVTVGATCVVTEPYDLTETIKRTKRQVIEAIFGEFRNDFMMIERALYDRDFQKSRALLSEFERKMFTAEE